MNPVAQVRKIGLLWDAARRHSWPPGTLLHVIGLMAWATIARHVAAAAPRTPIRLELPSGPVWFGAETFVVDAISFWDIFVTGPWPVPDTRFEGRSVIDVGGHRGFFAARSLQVGARRALSLEPHPGLFATLEQASEAAQERGHEWEARRLAIGAQTGTARLHLSSESWAHSLFEPVRGEVEDSIEVPIGRLEKIIEETAQQEGHGILIKLNIEGAAGRVVLSTPVERWQEVDELLLSYETNTPEPIEQVKRHLEQAGLILRASKGDNHWLSREPGE